LTSALALAGITGRDKHAWRLELKNTGQLDHPSDSTISILDIRSRARGSLESDEEWYHFGNSKMTWWV